MHLGNAFVRYLCVIIFKLFLVIQIMRIFFKNRKSWHFDVIFDCLAGRSGRVKKSLTRVDSEPGQEIGIEYPGRARMLVPKPGPAISLVNFKI